MTANFALACPRRDFQKGHSGGANLLPDATARTIYRNRGTASQRGTKTCARKAEFKMVEMISAVSGLLGAVSVLLVVAFLWRFGPSMGAALQRFSDALIVLAAVRHRQQIPILKHFLEQMNLIHHRAVTESRPLSHGKKRGSPVQRRLAEGAGYQVNYFARKHSITKEEAERLIKRVGNDREKLNRAAEQLKKAGRR